MSLHCGLRQTPAPAAIIFSGTLLLHEDLVENGPNALIRLCYWSMGPR